MLALMRFGRTTPRCKVEDWRAVQHPAIGITSCFAAPHAREDYVKVWLVAPPQRTRLFWTSESPRPSSAHSCNLRIGVESRPLALSGISPSPSSS